MQTPRSAAWFNGEDADPMLLGEKTDTSRSGSVDSDCRFDFWLLPAVFI